MDIVIFEWYTRICFNWVTIVILGKVRWGKVRVDFLKDHNRPLWSYPESSRSTFKFLDAIYESQGICPGSYNLSNWGGWVVVVGLGGRGVAFVEVKDQQGLIINRWLMNNDRLWIICYGCSGAMNDEGRQVSNYWWLIIIDRWKLMDNMCKRIHD